MRILQLRFSSTFALKSKTLIPAILFLNIPLQVANAESLDEALSYTLPEGRIVQLTIQDSQEYEKLREGFENYQFIRNGSLISLSSTLQLISSKSIINATAWTIDKDLNLIGVTDCTPLGFGLEECKSIGNLNTGATIFTTQMGDHIDPHELLSDSEGNLWFLSYPKNICKLSNEVCSKFNVPNEKFFVDCQVNKVSPSGELLYSWKASDHIPASNIIKSYTSEGGPNQKYFDLFHCNSIDLVGTEGFLISSRNSNAIYEVEMKTSKVVWKLGGHYWPGVSLRTTNFKRAVGKETIAQHDARYLGNGLYSFFDNESHTNKPARGVVFQVGGTNKKTARLVQEYVNPYGNNSLCTGSFRKVNEETFLAGWGCSLNAITLFTNTGLPIVTLNFLKTKSTEALYSDSPWMLNGVDWGPAINLGLTYRVVHTK